jgi:hypothetical protein
MDNHHARVHAAVLCFILACVQLCFDFIQSAADSQLYCIECNPRTSSVITEFHDSTQLAAGEVT